LWPSARSQAAAAEPMMPPPMMPMFVMKSE
jgi:hypothetical protein